MLRNLRIILRVHRDTNQRAGAYEVCPCRLQDRPRLISFRLTLPASGNRLQDFVFPAEPSEHEFGCLNLACEARSRPQGLPSCLVPLPIGDSILQRFARQGERLIKSQTSISMRFC